MKMSRAVLRIRIRIFLGRWILIRILMRIQLLSQRLTKIANKRLILCRKTKIILLKTMNLEVRIEVV